MALPCPKCHGVSRALRARDLRGGRARWRRLRCTACGHRYSSYELMETEYRAWSGVRFTLGRLRGALRALERWTEP